jgi:hypothetical protein
MSASQISGTDTAPGVDADELARPDKPAVFAEEGSR